MPEVWTDPSSYTTEQWLAVCILGFVLLAILVMIHRLLTILNMSRKPTYRPNFRRLRKVHSPRPGEKQGGENATDRQSTDTGRGVDE